MSGWADVVSRQVAAQVGAEALARAVRGEVGYEDVALEGPRVGFLPGEQPPARRMLGPQQPDRRALPPGRGPGRESGGEATVMVFCTDLAALLGVDPRAVARALGRLADQGWTIDVDRR